MSAHAGARTPCCPQPLIPRPTEPTGVPRPAAPTGPPGNRRDSAPHGPDRRVYLFIKIRRVEAIGRERERRAPAPGHGTARAPRGTRCHVRAVCTFSGQAPGGDSAPEPNSSQSSPEKKPLRSTFPAGGQVHGSSRQLTESRAGHGAPGEAVLRPPSLRTDCHRMRSCPCASGLA